MTPSWLFCFNEDVMSTTIIMAIAIALIIEGLVPALFPNKWRTYVLKLAKEPVAAIRQVGFVLVLIGIVMLWWIN